MDRESAMKTLPKKPRASKRRVRHPDKALSAAICRTVAKSGRYADGNGLYLHVDPSGARRWVQRLVIRGRSRGLGLGSYALVSLAELASWRSPTASSPAPAVTRWPPSGAPRACPRSRKRPRRWSRSTAAYREVSAAIAAVYASRGWVGAKLAFEFQVLTAARSAEVRLATWDEFDLGAMMWTVPGRPSSKGTAQPRAVVAHVQGSRGTIQTDGKSAR